MHLTDSDILPNLNSILTSLQKTVGWDIEVRIALTDRHFDRHGTTYTEFRMKVEEVHSRFSGGRIMISGTNSLIEMDIKRVQEYREDSGNMFRWVERLSGQHSEGSPILRSVSLSFILPSATEAGISEK